MATITNEQLLRLIKKTGDIKQFETTVNKVTLKSSRRLVESTPKRTGLLSKPWTRIKKIGISRFLIENNITTQDGKWNIAEMINSGTRRYTKAKGRLYIPLSSRARNKKRGAKIPKGYKWGNDFVLAKSRKGIKATHFIDNEEKKATKELEKAISKHVDRIIK